MVGVDYSLADLGTCCEFKMINTELKHQRPDFNWQKKVMGREKGKCSMILRGNTHSDVLRCRLEDFMNEFSSFG